MPLKIIERDDQFTTAPWTDAGSIMDMAEEVPLYTNKNGAMEAVTCARGIYNHGTGEVVATAGGRYQIVQHEEIYLSTLQALEALGVEPTKVSVVQSDKRMTTYIDLGKQHDVGVYGEGSIKNDGTYEHGDLVRFGIRLVNTYDGTAPIRGGLFAQRLACANGMLGSLRTVLGVTRKHTKSGVEDLDEALKTFVFDSVKEIESWVGRIRDAQDVGISKDEALRLIQGTLSKRVASKVEDRLDAYMEELGANRWAVYNAATHVITHDLNEPSQATLERHHSAANSLFTAEVPEPEPVAAE